MHDGKIGVGLRSPRLVAKPTRDIATSPPDFVRYPAMSLPVGSRAYLATQFSGLRGSLAFLEDGRSLTCIEEDGSTVTGRTQTLRPLRRGLRGRLTSEEDRGTQERPELQSPRSRRRRRRRLISEKERKDLDAFATQSDTEWSVVRLKRRRRNCLRSDKRVDANPSVARQSLTTVRGIQRLPRIRPPRSAAVAIRVSDNKISYAEIMKKARREVNLEQLSLGDTKIRKDVTGGLLIHILGKGSREKARQLQDKLQRVLGQEVRVTVPSKRAELRIISFDESVTENKITNQIATVGGCNGSDIKVGPTKLMANGLYAIWFSVRLMRLKVWLSWVVSDLDGLQRELCCFPRGSYSVSAVSSSDM